MNENDFTITEGDTAYLDMTVTDDTLDLMVSGVSVKWGLQRGSTTLIKNGSITGKNTFTVKLDPEDTLGLSGVYRHESEIIDSNGDVSTVIPGNVTIESGIIE